jgi:hypothetical protein
MDKTSAKEQIQALIAKYKSEADFGKLKKYSEEDVKKGFILPLFEALGWDPKDRDGAGISRTQKGGGSLYKCPADQVVRCFCKRNHAP